MNEKCKCEWCEKEFENYKHWSLSKARFCDRKCYNNWNKQNLIRFNNERFCYSTATKEEVKERIKQNFMSKVVMQSGCWDWSSIKDKNGYGLLHGLAPNGKKRLLRATRVSYEIFKGEFDQKLHVLHSCDNPVCCNPEHLFLGSHKKNMDDMQKKGRRAVGVKGNSSKLTESQVIEIRKLSDMGVSPKRIAEDFGISKSNVHVIKKRKGWTHI